MLPLAKPVEEIPSGDLATLRRKAAGCRACPLWRGATRTVFGKGPADAAAMLIGEQPGVQPRLVIGLGAMAAQTLFGGTFRIASQRGQWRDMGEGVRGVATWHPSAVLRMPHANRRDAAYAELVADLREVAAALVRIARASEPIS